MRNNQAQACTAVVLLAPASAANTAAATGTGVAVTGIEGDLLFTQHLGALTGSITGKIQECDDAGGTGAADITGATFTAATGAGIQKITVPRKAVTKAYVRYVGTIVTGPAIASASMHATAKYAS
jgi:hypothetical protein